MPPPRLLILGGAREATEIARELGARYGESLFVVTSWAGRTGGDSAKKIVGEFRVGGFGGSDGLAQYLREQKIDWVIDATHPFARQISTNARLACTTEGVPRLQVYRQGWGKKKDDLGIELDTLESAAERVADFGRRAFLSIGRGGVEAFAQVDGVHFLVRLLADPAEALPLKSYRLVIGRPPFAFEAERALLRQHRIQVVVSKDSGGTDGEAKIAAARDLGLPVIFIRRPEAEPGEWVSTVAEAVAWIAQRLDRGRMM